jgi:ankyrin repeat protein
LQPSSALVLGAMLAVAGCGGGDRAASEAATVDYRAATVLEAVLLKDAAAVAEFIAAGADVNAPEIDGTTLLMRAIHGRTPEIARLLIDAGADVGAANRYGVNPLYLAARAQDAASARALLDAGADPNIALPEGETALMTASQAGSVEIVRMLLGDPGLDPSPAAQTAAPAVTSGYGAVAVNTAPPLPRRADPNAKESRYGRTALMRAAAAGHADVVRLLLAAGADADATDDEGATPALLATLNGRLRVTRLLLEAGADPNAADVYGRTVLFAAVDRNALGADAAATAGDESPVDIVRLALAKGADPNAPLRAAPPTAAPAMADRDPILDKGATPLFRAAMSADLEIMSILLAAGADPLVATDERPPVVVDGVVRPSTGKTTSFMAAAGVGWGESASRGRESDALAALQLLLARGADIDAANQAGDTALHGAALRGSTAIIQFLADRGANLHAKNARGRTALDIASGIPEERIPYNEATARLLRRLTQQRA